MRTLLTASPKKAAEVIRRGGIVAFPTETVYGLGASVFDDSAVRKIFEAKQRPADNPLIAHIAAVEQLAEIALDVDEHAQKLIDAFFPGPLTIIFKKHIAVPNIATAGLDTIGVRMPRLEIAHDLLFRSGVPLVAPSANLSGRPSPTTWRAVLEDLDGRIDCILKGPSSEIGLESTVVDCSSEVPVLLRMGAVPFEELRLIVPELKPTHIDADVGKRSPGLKHRHYQPSAEVRIAGHDGNETSAAVRAAYIGINSPGGGRHFELEKICQSVETYASSVFEFFRECDRLGINEIHCEPISEEGIGAAIMDRLRRASGAI